jgi:hypothetical protein
MKLKNKIIITSFIIAVLVIGAVVWLYLWRRPQMVPELIGTWKYDPEATERYIEKTSAGQYQRNNSIAEGDMQSIAFMNSQKILICFRELKLDLHYRIVEQHDASVAICAYGLSKNRKHFLFGEKYVTDALEMRINKIGPKQIVLHLETGDDGTEFWCVYSKIKYK